MKILDRLAGYFNPSNYVKDKIRNRDLHKYIQEKRCSDLMIIYEVKIPAEELAVKNGHFEPETVVAPDPETAVWHMLTRKDPKNTDINFNRLYRRHFGNLKKLTRIVGQYGA